MKTAKPNIRHGMPQAYRLYTRNFQLSPSLLMPLMPLTIATKCLLFYDSMGANGAFYVVRIWDMCCCVYIIDVRPFEMICGKNQTEYIYI